MRKTVRPVLKPVASQASSLPKLEIKTDPNTGEKIVNLTIEEVIQKALANSPEIRIVSFDPSVSRLDITKAASEFDVTAFGDLNYETEDNPENSIYQAGQSNSRSIDAGLRQKLITGADWSLTYAFTRNWDDLSGRTFSTRYEPILSFQLRQPLLRNGWQQLNLAKVDIAKMNYQVAMPAGRETGPYRPPGQSAERGPLRGGLSAAPAVSRTRPTRFSSRRTAGRISEPPY